MNVSNTEGLRLKTERAGRRSRSKGPKRAPVPVARAMGELFAQLGIDGALRQYNILMSWPDVVGEQIARVTTAMKIERGILFVSVATAPWRAELVFRKPEIIQKLNHEAGRLVIRDIRFR
jgi:predicted nucleic acid-binding Zn ribbon protein